MRVALITEGTYPYVHGGVSVWCDRLIRRLPDVAFRLYALTATDNREAAWALPRNVVSLQGVSLESINERAFDRVRVGPRSRFLEAFDHFVSQLLLQPDHDDPGFTEGLRALHDTARGFPIDAGVCSAAAFDLIRSRWQARDVGDRLDRLGPPSLFDVLEVSSSLARFLKPLQVVPDGDVAHTTANGLGALVALSGAWERHMPILLTEHGVYLRERYLERPSDPVPERVQAFQLAFFRRLNAAMLRAADLVAPVSDFNRRWELSAGGDRRRIRTIHNGVDPDLFPPQIGEPEVPTITWVGRVDPLKDLKTLVDAFALVRTAVPAARLRLFGSMSAANRRYHGECLARIARHGLNGSVTFEGHIDQVSAAHEAGHVVVLSSISEGFPFTVIEAMMSGRATVSTDVGGVQEAVADCGILVPPRDPESLARALILVLTDRDLRHRLGRAARERALAMFTLDRMAASYREAYRAAIAHESMPASAASPDVAAEGEPGVYEIRRAVGNE